MNNHGKRCLIVGIADGTGCVEDPGGISWDELLRLVQEGHTLDHFNPETLSSSESISIASRSLDEQYVRDSMHNRVVADAFVPCGGRPNTMHKNNWQEYLIPNSTIPSAPIIVEGANLFLTMDARTPLTLNHTKIIKDSSANKCGVITSSYEIISAMLFDQDVFVEH